MKDVIMQYFEWYLEDDGQHWKRLSDDAQHLAEIGISMVWMPPATKATGTNDVGYGIYDLYDLGEFGQKGSVRTKYGTKDEYLEAINALKEHGIKPIADIVINHKAQGDEKEAFQVLKMDENNRQKPISEPYEIEGWTYFTFPGRQDQYSDFKWHWYHFSGLDYDARNDESGIYMILGEGKGWADNENVSNENANFDYLMFNDLDFSHPDVANHIREWIKWYIETTGVEGFRLDAVKHIDSEFLESLTELINENTHENFYIFGEYWVHSTRAQEEYLDDVNYNFDIVDVPLHNNFYEASVSDASYDMRKILDGSLMEANPMSAVTFVDNHDTQAGQSLATPVEDWFKPIAYGIILLMNNGLPTVFYGDYYGTQGPYSRDGQAEVIDKLLYLRQNYAYGEEQRYFDHGNVIGWTRMGDDEHPEGLAVVVSNSDEGWKHMSMGPLNAGKVYVDYLGHRQEEVQVDSQGWADFPVAAGSISVWVNKDTLPNLD